MTTATPATLAEAAAQGQHALCAELIGQGAAIEAADASGRTPLEHAIEQDNLPLLALLLEQGARTDTLKAACAERVVWRSGLTALTAYNRRRMGRERLAALYRLLECAAARQDRALAEFLLDYDRLISTGQRLEFLSAMAARGYVRARSKLLELAAALRDFRALTPHGRKRIPERTALAARATELAMTPQQSAALAF